jgi:hypothetical protein
MGENVIQSFGVLNYSGMLFNKGNTKVPFSTLIANRVRNTNSVEFTTGLEYATIGGSQPAISETASLTAPEATYITREQKTNVTQIFQESVYISYGKESNMGTLSGVNIAGQSANPANELDFQVAARMAKIARDIEYTFINGEYVKAGNDTTANKTRGILTAIETNNLNLNGEAIRVWDVAEAMRMIYNAQGSTNGLVLWVDPVAMFQLNADAEQNGNTIVPGARNVNGLAISTLLTPLGEIGLYLGEFLPAGTVGIFNPDVISRVEQPVPNKGNFFMEELAKTGAGTKYQIFGQLGLDHGPEWMHAKITGINTDFVKPKPGKKIYAIDAIPTVEVLPVLDKVVLSGTPTVGDATDALEITYRGTPVEAVTLAYQWKIASSVNGNYTAIEGKTTATYTPIADDVGKYIKCEVTASGTAVGKVLSNAKMVKPQEIEVTSEIEADDHDEIVVTLSAAVAGLTKPNFAVTKNGDAYTTFTVSAESGNESYSIALSEDAVATDVFTVTITKTGYDFVGTAVENNVPAEG